MPLANGFLVPDHFSDEYFFELAPALCSGCGMVQLVEQPDPEKMFHGDYPFFSHSSRSMAQHFKAFADMVRRDWLTGDDPFVCEIGSNDGILLKHMAVAGIRHLGVEPSVNVAAAARTHGVNTLAAFFNRDVAQRIRHEHGAASAIMAANVMCHIPDLPSVAAGVEHLLAADGVFIFEDPYLGAVLEKTAYDQIYDEHVFLFSLASVMRAFEPFGLTLVDAEPQSTHGGSMRYVLARHGRRSPSARLETLLAHEAGLKLTDHATFAAFAERCRQSRDRLVALLGELKADGKRVVGYAATSKSTTVLNYCGITDDLLPFIVDTTPLKQGRFTPGSHIPVRHPAAFADPWPDYALLFAWNHEAEILAKEDAFTRSGGRWIRFVPKVELIEV